MDAAITRRDFLGSTMLASGGFLLAGLTPAQLLAANDEWTGAMDHRYSILEAHRAVSQLLDQVLAA